MADSTIIYSVFIGSPGGLVGERKAFRELVQEWNEDIGLHHGVQFRVLGWEDAVPGKGRAQELINPLVERSDYFVLLLHNRWGTPPGPTERPEDPTSGTEEEFRLAEQCVADGAKAMRDIAPIFKAVSPEQLADPGEKLKPVIEFKKEIESRYSHLYVEFDEIALFQRIVRKLLYRWGVVDGGNASMRASLGDSPANDDLQQPQTVTTEDISKEVSEAERLADEGKLVEAEVKFASAVAGRADIDAIYRYGHFLYRVGRLAQAEAMYQRVLDIASDESGKAVAFGKLGLIEKTRGNLHAAEEYLKRSLAIEEMLGRKEGIANQLGNLGLIERTRGNLNAAEDYHKRSLAIEEALGRKEGMASDLGNLGLIEQTRGNLVAAEDYHKRSLAIEEALGHKEGMASQLGNLGLIERTRGNFDAAEDYHKRSLAIKEALGRKAGIASEFGNLGLIEDTRGNLDAAEDYYQRALAINETLGHKAGIAAALGNLGLIEEMRGNLETAEDYLIRSLAINEAIGSKEGMARNLVGLGLVAMERGDVTSQRSRWTRSRDLFREAQMPHVVEQVQGWLDALPPE